MSIFKKKPTVGDAVERAEEIVDGIRRQIDPEGQRVREAVQRQGKPSKVIPTPVDPETLAAEDAIVAEKKRQAAEAENINPERELRRHMTGAEIIERDRIMAQMAKDDFLRNTPYPLGEIVEVQDKGYLIRLQPHPNWPKSQMQGNTLVVQQVMERFMEDNEPRLRSVAKPQAGMTGILQNQTFGLKVIWLFVVDAA